MELASLGQLNLNAPFNKLLVVSVFGLLLWATALAIYRLYFSPIAKFPGPKLAALTQWYEVYYDIYLGGQYTLHMEKLHAKYGPIIRINPWELHINDPEFYETIYSTTSPFDKVREHELWGNTPLSGQSTVSHKQHRVRRAPLNAMFSKRQISFFAPEIQARTDILCNRMNEEYKGKGNVLTLNDAFGCFSADIVTEYTFAKDYGYLKYPNFTPPFVQTISKLAQAMHVLMLFPIVLDILVSLPEWLVSKLHPAMSETFAFQQGVKDQIEDIRLGRNQAHKDVSHPTVLKELLESNMPPHEKTLERIYHEGQVMVGAGLETTKWVLCVASFHILNNPSILKRFQEELIGACPNINDTPKLQELEKLPYLTAIIQESLRLSYGIVFRLPRNAPYPVQYKEYTIPPGSPFSMSIYYLHHAETVFPSSHTFSPSRWLADPITGAPPVGPDGEKLLTRYLASFSRGTRQCLGMHLAYAEIYICLANIFRRCSLELYETTERDVRVHSESFIGLPHPATKGIRVLVQ